MFYKMKTIICSIFIIIMALGFISGCDKIQSQSQKSTSLKSVQETGGVGVISANDIKNIGNSGEVSLTDDTAASIWWVPKNQKDILYEVISWLQRAKPYKGSIPEDQISAVVHANIEPSKLYITTSDKHVITIQPVFYLASNDGKYQVCYVAGILEFNNDKQKIYIQSNELFDWLKNNKWKTEFEMMK